VLRFSGAGVSDVGLVRDSNEDSAFVAPYVALVADGVGGAAAGEIASATAAYAVAAVALQRPGVDAAHVVSQAFAAARDNVRLGVQRDLNRLGMATTLTVVVSDGRGVVLGHVGDSRAYLLRAGELRQITTDHTYVQHLVETGRLSAQARATHPWRNVVLRSVDGDPEGSGMDMTRLDVRIGDRLLICSDGLTDLVDDARIASVLRGRDPESATEELTRQALAAGGRDNVTSVVVDVIDGPRVVGDGRLLGAMSDPANIVDAAAVRLA
jgi:PPM family protein phosphatase